MNRLKRIGIVLLLALILIQFIQPKRNNHMAAKSAEITQTVRVPPIVYDILQTACYDCHSNHTNYPWYSRIQPFGWLLASHIKEGKAELNFSEFGSYPVRRQTSKLNGIANSIRDATMPLSSYMLVHKNARLTRKQKELIIDWALKTKDSLRATK